MRNRSVRLAPLALLLIAVPLSGCISISSTSAPRHRGDVTRASSTEMNQLVESNKGLEIGMPRADALDLYPGRFLSLMSSAFIDNRRVEEWRADAVSRDRRSRFTRYLYFVDNRLVEFSSSRMDYRKNRPLLDQWFELEFPLGQQ